MDESMVDSHFEDSFTHVPEIWAVATETQRDTQEMEGGSKGKDQDDVHNKEAEQSTERDDDGQMGHVDPKDVIKTSNKEGTSVKIVNFNTRLYHEGGQSEKLRVWSCKDLEVGMHPACT